MAAGLGFKDFVTGEVLTAADVDGYLMQGVWVFASAAARDAAVTAPQEGNFAYLKDTNVTTYYTGSAWANLDTTGMTNPMTTTGDTIYSSSGSTPARLGIGTAGQVLQVNSGATAPEWATPAGGGSMTLLQTITLSGTSVTSSSFATTYKKLAWIGYEVKTNAADQILGRVNGLTTSIYQNLYYESQFASLTANTAQAQFIPFNYTDAKQSSYGEITNYGNTGSVVKSGFAYANAAAANRYGWHNTFGINTSAAISTITFFATNTMSGTVELYGVN
jgi:predicted small integral membrane protein